MLEFYDHKPMIDAPDSAPAATPFNITVRTYGDGCITSESTDVTVLDDGADIYVYDRRRIPGDNEACTLMLVYLPHEATLSFANAGLKVIRIHGRHYDPPLDEALDVAREVTIQ
jgi:hypothetical protein